MATLNNILNGTADNWTNSAQPQVLTNRASSIWLHGYRDGRYMTNRDMIRPTKSIYLMTEAQRKQVYDLQVPNSQKFTFHPSPQPAKELGPVLGSISPYVLTAMSSRLRASAERGELTGTLHHPGPQAAVQALIDWMNLKCRSEDIWIQWPIDLSDLEPSAVVGLIKLACSLGINLSLMKLTDAVMAWHDYGDDRYTQLNTIATRENCRPLLAALDEFETIRQEFGPALVESEE